MAEMCTFWGTELSFSTSSGLNANSTASNEVISVSGLNYRAVVLRKDSFSHPAGGSRKCYAPIKDHTPLRITSYFDDSVYDAGRTAALGTATETLTLNFGSGGGQIVMTGKVLSVEMGENTMDDRPTMITEWGWDGVGYTVT